MVENGKKVALIYIVSNAKTRPVPFNSRLNVVVRSPTSFGFSQNGCWPSRESQLLGKANSHESQLSKHSLCLNHFFAVLPPERPQRAARSFFKIGRLSSLFCLSLAPFRLILLLMMSGNVHPNPGPVFLCLVGAGNVTWQGRSVQCCICSKWVHS